MKTVKRVFATTVVAIATASAAWAMVFGHHVAVEPDNVQELRGVVSRNDIRQRIERTIARSVPSERHAPDLY